MISTHDIIQLVGDGLTILVASYVWWQSKKRPAAGPPGPPGPPGKDGTDGTVVHAPAPQDISRMKRSLPSADIHVNVSQQRPSPIRKT